MNADEHYGEYLKAEDIKRPILLTIEDAVLENVDRDFPDEKKIVLSFEEIQKKLVLNMTNKNIIKENLGTSETDVWKGKKIVLNVESVEFKSKKTPAIRVVLEKIQPQPVQSQPVQPQSVQM